MNDRLAEEVLAFLGLRKATPTFPVLEKLLAAYYCAMPWETASRIVRRAQAAPPSPRWPDLFWQEAMASGCGGTCFESNYAFFALLRSLGYEGYLTINNMGDNVGWHTAIIIFLEGQKWMVDVGIPLYTLLQIDSGEVTHRGSAFLDYTVRPDGPSRYQIEQRPHPNPNVFTLMDEPVDDARYRAATEADYGETGLFLDYVIINKVVGNQRWRFNMSERPWRLNRFDQGTRFDTELTGDVPAAVAGHFGMDAAIVRKAFELTRHNYPNGQLWTAADGNAPTGCRGAKHRIENGSS